MLLTGDDKLIENPLLSFHQLTTRVNRLISDHGMDIHCDPVRVYPHFFCADLQKQLSFLRRLKLYIELLEEAQIEGMDVMRDKMFLWKSFQKIRVIPSSDLFEKIIPGDYIEVYDSTGVQLFSNFEFLAILSYSFEEVLWWPWDELFGRHPENNEPIGRAFEKCFLNASGPFHPGVEEHLCWEVRSPEMKKAKVLMKMFAPIFGKDKKPKAMLATSTIKVINN